MFQLIWLLNTAAFCCQYNEVCCQLPLRGEYSKCPGHEMTGVQSMLCGI